MSAAISKAREATPQLEPARAHGTTPLMNAVCDDSVDVVRALLDGGADVNAKRNDGFTALALASFFGRTRIVELLLERGADVRAVTRFGTSPEIWAQARGFQEIVDLLQNVPPIATTSGEHVSVHPEEDGEVTSRTLVTSRILPEIHDPPPLIAPAFHPGHAFIARISSDRRSLAALVVALVVTLGLAVVAAYHIKSRLRIDVNQPAAANSAPVPEPQAAVVTQEAQAAPQELESAPQESGSNQELGSKQATTSDLPNKAASGPSEEIVTPSTMVKPSIKTVSTPRLSHSSFPGAQRETVTRRELKRAPEPEIESKPAPLTVEVSRDRNTPAPAPHPANSPPPQAAPLGITTSKPRSKVIQWP